MFIPLQMKAELEVAAVERWELGFYMWEILQKPIIEKRTSKRRYEELCGHYQENEHNVKTILSDHLTFWKLTLEYIANVETFTQENLLNLCKNNENRWHWNQTIFFFLTLKQVLCVRSYIPGRSNQDEGDPYHWTF